MRHFLHLSFLGTNYHGWQRQPDLPSVQQTLEDNLSKMLGVERQIIYGCGRTDSGVHASQYFAHVDLPEQWDYDPLERINRMLPNSITIHDMIPVHAEANARYDVTFRTYEYYIHFNKNSFNYLLSSYYPIMHLDRKLMHEACLFLLEVKDFRSLCKVPDRHNHTLCNLTNVDLIFGPDGEGLLIRFRADRYLQRMIRLIVQQLLNIGQGKISLNTFKENVLHKESIENSFPAYPQGLFLSKVEYPYLGERSAEIGNGRFEYVDHRL